MSHIVVSDLSNDTFYAKIVIKLEGKEVEIDSRPSDAIALAVRVGVAIYVEDEVMSKAGVSLDSETGEPVVRGERGDRAMQNMSEDELQRLSAFQDFIGELDLEDFDKK